MKSCVINERKQFSKLKKRDVEKAWNHFEKRETSNEEKVKLTRDLLGRSQIMFTSKRFLKSKLFEPEWILKRHSSTMERFDFYPELYSRIFEEPNKKYVVFDLGAGVNGFSYQYLPKSPKYIAVESIGQLAEIQNIYFESKKINAKVIHESLFNLKAMKKILSKEKGEKILFLFKVIDSLEMLEKNFSKKFLKELVPLANKIIVSFATRSLVGKTKFKVNRNWFLSFAKEFFKILDDFEIGNERYLVFKK